MRYNFFKNKSEKEILKEKPLTTSFDVYKKRNKIVFDLFDSVKHKNIFRIYPSELFCNTTIEGRCLTHNENDVYYYDHNHLSSIGSEMLAKKILTVIKKNK